MIVFDLHCAEGGETFEAWFRSGADYELQLAGGLIQCPMCGSSQVSKAPMAPSVPRKGAAADALQRLAQAQAELLGKSRWVGGEFAKTARAIHDGEREPEAIHGEASVDEAIALAEDGVPLAPLPFPVIPPDQLN